ncbi:hypothetical protein ACJJTC_003243 [Scirpophaga incertulas]
MIDHDHNEVFGFDVGNERLGNYDSGHQTREQSKFLHSRITDKETAFVPRPRRRRLRTFGPPRARSLALFTRSTFAQSIAADTVSVLQQAPGTLNTRAPDEVQSTCGGFLSFRWRRLADCGDDSARYFSSRPAGAGPSPARRQTSADRAAPALTLARPPARGARSLTPPAEASANLTPPAAPLRRQSSLCDIHQLGAMIFDS